MEKWEGWMAVITNQCAIKVKSEKCMRRWCQSCYNKIKITRKHCLPYMKIFKAKIQSKSLHKPSWCARPRPGNAQSASITIFACSLFHNKIEHKNAPPWALTSSHFPSGSLMLREGKKNVRRETMKALVGGFLRFECKERYKILIIKVIF